MGRNTLARAVVGALAAGALVFTTAGACGGAQPGPAPQQQQQGGDQDDQDGDQDDGNGQNDDNGQDDD